MEQDFTTKLLRFMAAELHVNTAMYAARDIFGQSLFDLSDDQKRVVAEKVHEQTRQAFAAMTEPNLTPPSESGQLPPNINLVN